MNEDFYRYKPRTMLRFEVQVAEHCNLNCRNCAHYSPLAEEEYLDLVQYEKDLQRLSELFCGEMEWIHLMGGEPLLHPEIIKIMRLTRKYFKYGRIYIVTNGLNLLSMPEEFFEACHQERVQLSVTKYPIKLDYSKIKDEMEKKRIDCVLSGDDEEGQRSVMWRFALDTRGDANADKNFYACARANECLNLRNGRLYTCCTVAHVHHLVKYFDEDIAWTERNSIDIYSAKDAESIMEKMAKPIPFCRYCNPETVADFGDAWAISKKDRYEWMSFNFSDSDINYLKSASEVYVYGAGNWGKQTVDKLEAAGVPVTHVVVTEKAGNCQKVNEVDVIALDELDSPKKDAVCIIAINGASKIAIQSMLFEKGIKKVIPIMKM